MSSRGRLIGNALWLQLGWWGCVLGAQHVALLAAVAAGLIAHLWLCRQRAGECLAILTVGVAGCVLDVLLGVLGLFDFHGEILPVWLALLWLVFASGLRHCLAWAASPAWWGGLLGAAGGPLAYWGGASLAGVGLPWGNGASAVVLALVWAVWLPLMLKLALRW
ncbi:TPA: DUF2878 domain-containing protein [Pseudomonas aeruginosa]|uniref:DUF2878 domain-containing protein n=1 Tax=Pseudomonas aeruginosa TaxID=287 RepID=UPI00290A75F8|nr:DUF2878 domain-containing protein [Pseudomonas aeruginosa]WSP21946.1 DUF2878 domain-containing protein [Pseudomonas aeruginosa]HBP6730419.1 DUF2878 domain-containing protein [Pseudomonas aeruginosa]HCF6085803.1 DUF2878 domain-containing protein [Pseudomonas aeruginosa]